MNTRNLKVENNHTKAEAIEALTILREFMPQSQLRAIGDCCRGEEKQFFFNKLVELTNTIQTMPKTYEQDGKGKEAIAYLHYFRGSAEWYITEKDAGSADDLMETGQIQVFGLADLGDGFPELGYISIVELIENDVELDMHFTQKTLAEIAHEA